MSLDVGVCSEEPDAGQAVKPRRAEGEPMPVEWASVFGITPEHIRAVRACAEAARAKGLEHDASSASHLGVLLEAMLGPRREERR